MTAVETAVHIELGLGHLEVPLPPPRRRGRPSEVLRIPRAPVYLIQAANAFVGLNLDAGAVRAFGQPPSVAERFLQEVRAVDDFPLARPAGEGDELPPWDAAFVSHVGYWAFYREDVERSTWPLPPVSTAQELSELAGHWGLLDDAPLNGDLFLLWNPALGCYGRTGIVTCVRQVPRGDPFVSHRCTVIEGDTSEASTLGGGMVLRRDRWFGPGDRFVRWTKPDDARGLVAAEELECL